MKTPNLRRIISTVAMLFAAVSPGVAVRAQEPIIPYAAPRQTLW